MSKEADNITRDKLGAAIPASDETSFAALEPSNGVVSADVPPGAPPPTRTTGFGGGADGSGGGGERRVTGADGGFIERAGQFLRDVRSEMRRVTWPTGNEVKNTTIITVVAVIFFAVYLFAVDQGLAFFITQLERAVNWLFGGI